MSIKEFLLVASTSPIQNQRDNAIQQLRQLQKINEEGFFQQLFYMLCYNDRTIHILAYSYFKQLLLQNKKERFANLNQNFQKAYMYWEGQNLQRVNLNQIFDLQRQNIIELASKYLGLIGSARFRQSFISQVSFKLYNKFQSEDLKNLQIYLKYFSKVIYNLLKSNAVKAMTRKNLMGALMLNKIIPLLRNQNVYFNSLWVNLFIHYGRYCEWTPDKNYLIDALCKFTLSKATIIDLSEFLVDKVSSYCSLQDNCNILGGLQKAINVVSNNLAQFGSSEAQILLKSYRSFLYNIFSSNCSVSSQNQAMYLQYLKSYEHFQNILKFIMAAIEHYTIKSQYIEGCISPMLVQYSTQIISLYPEYLQNQSIYQYVNRFKSNFQSDKLFQKMLILLSGMPKTILQIFNYEEVINTLISQQIIYKQQYQIVYLTFIGRYINVNLYIQEQMIQKLFFFLVQNIKRHQKTVFIYQNSETNKNMMIKIDNQKGLISQSLSVLSRLSKYKLLANNNQTYFNYLIENLFKYLLEDSNYISMISQSFSTLIKQQIKEWNVVILEKTLQKMYLINNSNQKSMYRQKLIQLYRLCKSTMNVEYLISKGFDENNHSNLTNLIKLCELQLNDEPIKQQILFNVEQIMLQLNQFSQRHNQSAQITRQVILSLIKISTFQQIYQIFKSTCILEEMQINNFQKVEFNEQEYLILPQKLCNNIQLHTCCIRILIQLLPYKQYLQSIVLFLTKSKSQYLNCLWEAILILYPEQINRNLVPEQIKERVDKIMNGNIVQLFEKIALDQKKQLKNTKQNLQWFKLYRQIVSPKSVVNQFINIKIQLTID